MKTENEKLYRKIYKDINKLNLFIKQGLEENIEEYVYIENVSKNRLDCAYDILYVRAPLDYCMSGIADFIIIKRIRSIEALRKFKVLNILKNIDRTKFYYSKEI